MHGDEQILAVGIVEAARRLAVSARTVAALVARGELASRKLGRRRIIPVEALESFINGMPHPQERTGRARNKLRKPVKARRNG
jgi:excisionase family DNA binding protein